MCVCVCVCIESNDDCQTGGSSPSHDRVEQFVLAAPPPTDGAIIGSSNNMATPDAVNEKYLHDHCLGIFQHFRSESPPTPVHHQPDDVTENDCEVSNLVSSPYLSENCTCHTLLIKNYNALP